uniref:BHLH domain-containing protein n=1 Tax=Mesocestoides corti TaxID=53468 RepID=A0A5K3F248_MESCO
DHQTCRRPWHNVRARVNGFLCLLACQKHLIYKMESVSNNEYAATSSQTQIGSTNYIRGRELLTHFANLTNQDRRKTIVQNRSSPESSSSPNSASMYSQSGSNPIGSSGGSNNNNSEDLRACSEIYSAILSSQQSGSGIDDRHRLRPVSFSSPTRHLSEPATAAVRRSPNDFPVEISCLLRTATQKIILLF